VDQYEQKAHGPPGQGVSGQGACKRCGGLLELSASLPRRLDSPAYEIFRCGGCGFIDWVAQDVS